MSDDNEELFKEGWLLEHLSHVVNDIAKRPVELQPRLTGERSKTMTSPYWLTIPVT